jgi:FixJ family two-component response regulator
LPEAAKISVVDDDDSMRQAISALIESDGQNVEVYCSAEDFLGSGGYQGTACLILDVCLPGMSGLELQGHLTASGWHVPIVFVSAHGDENARDRALEAGAVEFLQKPFSERELFRAINLAFVVHGDGNSQTREGG